MEVSGIDSRSDHLRDDCLNPAVMAALDHDVALRKIAETGWNALPVVSRDNVRQWKGTISLQDILAAYGVANREG